MAITWANVALYPGGMDITFSVKSKEESIQLCELWNFLVGNPGMVSLRGEGREDGVWAWHVLGTKYAGRATRIYQFQPPQRSYSRFTTAGKENLEFMQNQVIQIKRDTKPNETWVPFSSPDARYLSQAAGSLDQ